jgi:hypothetical protein
MKIIRRVLNIVVVLLLCNTFSNAQQTPEDIIKKDYPNLYELYADSIGKQSAHYIFVIDVSSFMRTNLQVLKPMIIDFVNALPNGDQVTLIRKSSTERTGFVGGITNLSINSSTKNHIRDVLHSDEFAVQNAGSDGYTATAKVIDAITMPESSNLVFVFMFTDFEYWTNTNNCYKNAEDWNALKGKLAPFISNNGRVVLPYAIFFPDNPQTCSGKDADYREDLIDIFGSLSQPPTHNSDVLKNWFSQMKTNILAYRMKFLIYKDLTELVIKASLRVENDGIYADLTYAEELKILSLYKGYKVKITDYPESLNNVFLSCDTISLGCEQVKLFSRNNDYKPIFPKFLTLTGEVSFELTPVINCNDQVDMLNQLDNLVKLNYITPIEFKENLPEKTYFLHILPGWLDILIISLILAWITCFLITKIKKITRNWQVSVSWRDKAGNHKHVSEDFYHAKQFSIGSDGSSHYHLDVPGASWKIKIETRNNCPCKLWKKAGYYFIVEYGSNVQLEYPYDSEIRFIGSGQDAFLSKPGKFLGGIVNIEEDNISFKINID